jgi:alanine-synthesizing transaminase
VHYPCRPENGFVPDPEELAALVTPQTRAIVIINPNNPTGAVYTRNVLEAIARLAEERRLVVFADEIYDQMTYDGAQFVPMATLVHDTLCATLSGLSKVYRACGYRVGWAAFSGRTQMAADYLHALELLASLRLCSNVTAQWAVQTALGGHQSVRELVGAGGRLHESRATILAAVQRSRFLTLAPPQGSMYAFVGVNPLVLPDFDDQQFALDLLEQKHVLVAPGVSFNVPYRNHFRITNLPEAGTLREVFTRIEELLATYAELLRRPGARGSLARQVLRPTARVK